MKKLLALVDNRPDLAIIASWIDENKRVLDLGCGNGALLHYLIHNKKVNGMGVEIDRERVVSCLEKGIPVVEQDLNQPLSNFPDQSFDYVILSQTVQEVVNPDTIIREILRVGRYGIVSFPNFGHLPVRMGLLFGGRMPKSRALPYEWFNTPNIHMMTYKDFQDFCVHNGIRILKTLQVSGNRIRRWALWPNLFSEGCVALISR